MQMRRSWNSKIKQNYSRKIFPKSPSLSPLRANSNTLVTPLSVMPKDSIRLPDYIISSRERIRSGNQIWEITGHGWYIAGVCSLLHPPCILRIRVHTWLENSAIRWSISFIRVTSSMSKMHRARNFYYRNWYYREFVQLCPAHETPSLPPSLPLVPRIRKLLCVHCRRDAYGCGFI